MVGVIGDVAVDVLMRVPDLPFPGEDAFAQESATYIGGCGANVCTMLARLGVTPRLFAKVGKDLWGQHALSSLADEGVDTQSVTVDEEASTHLTVVVVTADGERTILGHRGASSRLQGQAIAQDSLNSLAMLVISGYSLLSDPQRSTTLHAIESARAARVPMLLDLPAGISRRAAGAIGRVVPHIDLLISDEEDTFLLGGSGDLQAAMHTLAEQAKEEVRLPGPRNAGWVGWKRRTSTSARERVGLPPTPSHLEARRVSITDMSGYLASNVDNKRSQELELSEKGRTTCAKSAVLSSVEAW